MNKFLMIMISVLVLFTTNVFANEKLADLSNEQTKYLIQGLANQGKQIVDGKIVNTADLVNNFNYELPTVDGSRKQKDMGTSNLYFQIESNDGDVDSGILLIKWVKTF